MSESEQAVKATESVAAELASNLETHGQGTPEVGTKRSQGDDATQDGPNKKIKFGGESTDEPKTDTGKAAVSEADTAIAEKVKAAQETANGTKEEAPKTAAPKAKPANGSGKTDRELTHDDLKSLTVRQYLEKTVVPVLLQGMQEIVKSRPEDPFEALADFIKKNKPAAK